MTTELVRESLYLRTMGRDFKVVAIATSDAEANAYMEAHPGTGAIADEGGFVFIANIADKGVEVKR